jgi:head-tail adaptor
MRIDRGETLRPGLLRHQITWERKVPADPPQNEWGEDVFTWQGFLTCKAQIKELTGRELQFANQRWAEAQYQLLQHYVPNIEMTDRISWWIDGKVILMDILSILDPPGTLRYQEIIAKERVP